MRIASRRVEGEQRNKKSEETGNPEAEKAEWAEK